MVIAARPTVPGMHPPHGSRGSSRRARNALVIALLTAASAGCHPHDVSLVLELHGLVPSPGDLVDVYVLQSCPASGQLGADPVEPLLHETFSYASSPMPLGTAQRARAAVYARVRVGPPTCALIAAGCTDDVPLGEVAMVAVALTRCLGGACPGTPSASTCQPGRADAGDAGDPMDGCVPTELGERCDDVDNDCNGLIDDGLTQPCAIDSCTDGAQTCVRGQWGRCMPTMPPGCAGMPGDLCTVDATTANLRLLDNHSSLSGSTCRQPDHFTVAGHVPCTPDFVYRLHTDLTARFTLTSTMPMTLLPGCNARPTMCGSTLELNPATGPTQDQYLVLESPDGGCGDFTVNVHQTF